MAALFAPPPRPQRGGGPSTRSTPRAVDRMSGDGFQQGGSSARHSMMMSGMGAPGMSISEERGPRSAFPLASLMAPTSTARHQMEQVTYPLILPQPSLSTSAASRLTLTTNAPLPLHSPLLGVSNNTTSDITSITPLQGTPSPSQKSLTHPRDRRSCSVFRPSIWT